MIFSIDEDIVIDETLEKKLNAIEILFEGYIDCNCIVESCNEGDRVRILAIIADDHMKNDNIDRPFLKRQTLYDPAHDGIEFVPLSMHFFLT